MRLAHGGWETNGQKPGGPYLGWLPWALIPLPAPLGKPETEVVWNGLNLKTLGASSFCDLQIEKGLKRKGNEMDTILHMICGSISSYRKQSRWCD